jgi:signal transduction histidine kinase
VLFNLLSNAIAFTPDGGTVEVGCVREGQQVVFEVRDHGFGIPQDYLDIVFDRFETRSSGARRRGAGLGLSIVKSFVELHGGTVEIASREGEGTLVRCHFPATPRLAEAAE